MTTNSKFRTGSKEAPTEPFKRAVTSCLRAIAKAPELEVTFAAERPGLSPGKARLPEPARKMSKRDAAVVRGHGCDGLPHGRRVVAWMPSSFHGHTLRVGCHPRDPRADLFAL